MLSAIIILSLLSLLVATDADHASVPAEAKSPEPLRPAGRLRPRESTDRVDQLAA